LLARLGVREIACQSVERPAARIAQLAKLSEI
jgi:hypothetical protein